MHNKLTLPETGFVRLPTILKFIPIGRSSWLDGVKLKKFPQPVKLGPRTTAWRAEDINSLITEFGNNLNKRGV